ncbi:MULTISPECIES: Dabb family protein [Corynebacterium]|uniref:Stress protein n=1 Tax=Corynebacterium crudilactis TaxID=1652495 RepID=A0A172QQ43_9CORY|nr:MULTISPECIES: Dabb family protein [Corynebacterium]ALZ98811.1 stress protein [Corynebacterium glutamicum]ANE02807.1 stress protein [Corynebacterium crudilactis]
MIRHILMIRWKDTFTDEIRAKWVDGLEKMQGAIPGLIHLSHGQDILKTEKSWDHVIIADFISVEDIAEYNTHPAHEAIKPYSLPNAAELAYVDFEIPQGQEHLS